MQNNQNNPNIQDVEAFFNQNSGRINAVTSASLSDNNKSNEEREFLFGLSLESFGLENLDNWIKYEAQRSDIWIKHEEFRLKKANSDSERELREKNAKLAFEFAKHWAIFIGLFILLHGFNNATICIFSLSFNITETEFMFVCGTLTASILIFYLTVIKNLFPNKPQ